MKYLLALVFLFGMASPAQAQTSIEEIIRENSTTKCDASAHHLGPLAPLKGVDFPTPVMTTACGKNMSLGMSCWQVADSETFDILCNASLRIKRGSLIIESRSFGLPLAYKNSVGMMWGSFPGRGVNHRGEVSSLVEEGG